MHWMSEYVLPHPEQRSRGKLLSPLALFSYSFFLLSLFFSTRLLAYRLPGVLGYASNIKVEDLLRIVNQKRAGNGAEAVRLDPVLCEVAQQKAEDMFAKGYWSHVSPEGAQPWGFFLRAGYDYLYAGENLAKDFQDSESVVEAWMNSSSHRNNLISPKYEDMGLAVVNGRLNGYETTLVVQEFGRRKVEPTLAKSDLASPSLPQAQAATTEGSPPEAGQPVMSLPAVDVFAASKAISLLLAGFLAGLFLLDGWFIWRKGWLPRLSGHTLAHLGLLILAMLGIWYVNAGVIL